MSKILKLFDFIETFEILYFLTEFSPFFNFERGLQELVIKLIKKISNLYFMYRALLGKFWSV